MDFIERILDLSPDGGSGTTELAYVLVLLVIVAGVVITRRRRSRPVQ